MEYIFGAEGEIEVLKVKGGSHTNLMGFHQVEQVFPDQTITDSFRVVRKLRSDEDGAGNCYDWYEIDRHYRTTDKTGPLAEQTVEMETALCEQDAAVDERMGALEDAVCELDGLVNGGGEIQ